MKLASIQEKSALVEFRKAVEDFAADAPDHYLLRWLRARDLDVKNAKEMLLKSLEWRRRHPELETISSWKPPIEVAEGAKYKYSGTDYDGRPVFFVPVGTWKSRELIESGLKEDLIQHVFKVLEEAAAHVEKVRQSNGTPEVVLVFDCAGLTLWKIASIELIQISKQLLKDFENNYPETLSRVVIINAHWVFYYAFKLIKHVMSPRTLGKIQIMTHNADWKTVLEDYMPTESIPLEYGGQGEPIMKLE